MLSWVICPAPRIARTGDAAGAAGFAPVDRLAALGDPVAAGARDGGDADDDLLMEDHSLHGGGRRRPHLFIAIPMATNIKGGAATLITTGPSSPSGIHGRA